MIQGVSIESFPLRRRAKIVISNNSHVDTCIELIKDVTRYWICMLYLADRTFDAYYVGNDFGDALKAYFSEWYLWTYANPKLPVVKI